jgi:hypothetical protein
MTTFIRIGLVTVLMSLSATATWLVAQNSFGTPKTIIHVSLIQWKEGVSAADRQQVLNGVKEMAAKIPGMKNVWTKAIRVQPQGYAKDPVHDEWTKALEKVREASISPQITND